MKLLTSLAAVLALSLTVNAADEKKPADAAAKPKVDPATAFGKLDKDGNKAVSLDEFKATKAAQKDLAKAEATFKKRDKDANGSLSLEEFSAAPAGKKNK